MFKNTLLCTLLALAWPVQAADPALQAAIAKDYSASLAPLFDYLHRNPELSFMETKTAARLAQELRAAGFAVTEGVGKTGVVAILKNGPGPMVMVRADMDGLPVEEKSGLANASKVVMPDWAGKPVPVMHACGHDVHMTSLVGTAHQMAARKNEWKGTLMLIGQPAEERVGGARDMMKDNIWQRFGKPDYALSLHVVHDIPVGQIHAEDGPTYSGVDSLEIIVHGIGAHGAAPHAGKDPVVLAAQIVLALQTVVTRDLAPREAGLITVGSLHAGSKPNIISDLAKLELTVRYENPAARRVLLDGIERVAKNMGRVAGLPENLLPEVRQTDDPAPPTVNDIALAQRLKKVWSAKMGPAVLDQGFERSSMVAEDFAGFISSPLIPAVYFRIGGSSAAAVAAMRSGGPLIPSNHSPQFKADAEGAVRTGVEANVVALLDLMAR